VPTFNAITGTIIIAKNEVAYQLFTECSVSKKPTLLANNIKGM
jgi:hypothetical protein